MVTTSRVCDYPHDYSLDDFTLDITSLNLQVAKLDYATDLLEYVEGDVAIEMLFEVADILRTLKENFDRATTSWSGDYWSVQHLRQSLEAFNCVQSST